MKDAPKRFRIRITSSEAKGRYVGPRFGGGLVTDPDLQKNPSLNVPGLKHSLYAQEGAATEFFEGNTAKVQAELKALGYESELVEVV